MKQSVTQKLLITPGCSEAAGQMINIQNLQMLLRFQHGGCPGQSRFDVWTHHARHWGGKEGTLRRRLGKSPSSLPGLTKPHALHRPTWSPSTSSAPSWAGPQLMPCAPSWR